MPSRAPIAHKPAVLLRNAEIDCNRATRLSSANVSRSPRGTIFHELGEERRVSQVQQKSLVEKSSVYWSTSPVFCTNTDTARTQRVGFLGDAL